MAHDAFQVPHASTAAELLFGVECHNGVPALPDAFRPGVAPEADAVAQGPHADELIELSSGSGDSGGHHVRVVEDESRHRPVFLPKRGRQERLQVESLRLLQIGRVLHYAIADDARKAHADGLDGLAAAGQLDLGPDRVPDVLDGHHLDLRLGAF